MLFRLYVVYIYIVLGITTFHKNLFRIKGWKIETIKTENYEKKYLKKYSKEAICKVKEKPFRIRKRFYRIEI